MKMKVSGKVLKDASKRKYSQSDLMAIIGDRNYLNEVDGLWRGKIVPVSCNAKLIGGLNLLKQVFTLNEMVLLCIGCEMLRLGINEDQIKEFTTSQKLHYYLDNLPRNLNKRALLFYWCIGLDEEIDMTYNSIDIYFKVLTENDVKDCQVSIYDQTFISHYVLNITTIIEKIVGMV